MDIPEVLRLYDRDERRETEELGMRREEAPGVVRLVDLRGASSAVIYAQLDAAKADAVIRREIAYFDALGHTFEWKLYDHDLPADLSRRLLDHGFTADEREAIMVLDLGEPPPALLGPVPAAVRRITAPEDLRDVTQVREAVWPGEHLELEGRLGHMLRTDPQRLSVYAVYDGDEPVCAGRIHFPRRSSFASLWGGATLPGSRERGFYTALLAVRVQEAIARRMRYLTIDASAMSRPIVEKHGFQLLTWAQAHLHKPAAATRGGSD